MGVIGYSFKVMHEPQVEHSAEPSEAQDSAAEEARKIEQQSGRLDEMLQAVTPIVLEVASDLVGFVDDSEVWPSLPGRIHPDDARRAVLRARRPLPGGARK